MTTFVTGGTGFIGTKLIEALVTSGEEVKALTRKTSDVKTLEGLGVEITYGDILDRGSLSGEMKGCDTLFHLANIYEWWIPDINDYYRINVEGTKFVLSEALSQGINKAIYVCTAAALGQKKGEIGNEQTEHREYHLSQYTKSKYFAEQEALKISSEGLYLVRIHPSAVFGPGDTKVSGKVVLDFLEGKTPGIIFPNTKVALVYVYDVVKGLLLAKEKGKPDERYILSGGNLSMREIYDLISEVAGIPPLKRTIPDTMVRLLATFQTAMASVTKKPPHLAKDFVRFLEHGFMLDNTKSKEELGLEYTPFPQAFKETIDWMKETEIVSK